jgi:hypothetical protein
MRHLATCACDKLIIDKNGAHSLVSIMSNADISIVVQSPAVSEQIPTNAVTPREWWIFSMWEPSSEDVGEQFEQVYQIYWPNNEKLSENRIGFKPDERVQYNSQPILGFPVGQSGKIRIVTWVDHHGQRVTEVFDYYITIKHITQAEAQQKGVAGALGVFQASSQSQPQ